MEGTTMLKKLLLVVASASLLLAASASASSTGWRTALVANNEDLSEFGYVSDYNRTTLRNVHALRVRLSTSKAAKLTAEVKCDRGESSGSRKLTFNQVAGVRVRPLPVPLPGGVCDVEVDVNLSDGGRYDLLLQYQ
jgi:hypothetical protein